jgi:hypothetical protein
MRGKLSVYEITECGYYARGAETHSCCDPPKLAADIHLWISGKKPTIEETRTFAADQNGTYLPVYCFDTARGAKHGDFLITTWNETPSDDGTIGAVVRNDVAGSAGVKTANLPTNSIPGYGTHFWVLPQQRRLVTVRFDAQPLNGHAGLNLYMRGYLERFSPHVRFDDPTMAGSVFVRNVLGYALDDKSADADEGLRPRFRSILLRRDSEIAFIKKNRAKINKIIRKGRPSDGGQTTKTLLDRMLRFVGADSKDRGLPDNNYVFEVAYTPSEKELSNIIATYQSEEHETWDDIGFDFKGDPTRRWLSSSTLKAEIDVADGLRDGPSSLAAASALLDALQAHRQTVLA